MPEPDPLRSEEPDESAGPTTPVASSPGDVARLAAEAADMAAVDARISVCRACPRLVAWREEVGRVRRPAYADQTYWSRPVPGFGSARPAVLVIGLAPSAHGANRTGRNFTGDRSGDWLYAALHRAGLASQAESVAVGDGMELYATRIVAAVRCAPPANRPTAAERLACRPWLRRQVELAWPTVRSVVVLGAIGWEALWPVLRAAGVAVPDPVPRFGHDVRVPLPGGRLVLGCYHVSPQNTNTGRLTAAMLDAVLGAARDWALPHRPPVAPAPAPGA